MREELDDWNCCGATMYMAVDEQQAFAMAARNLALAEQQWKNGNKKPKLMTPCAACYAVLNKTKRYISEYPSVKDNIFHALSEGGLSYNGHTEIKHPLDVIVNDVGLDKIVASVQRPLIDLKVACYYGCLLVRPYADFDDSYSPMSMDHLMRTIGATPINWDLKTRCCGAALTGTISDVGIRMSYIILSEAIRKGADVIATACPFCQSNLECYQKQMKKDFGLKKSLPVAYFSQLLGIAMGLPDDKIGLQHLFKPLPIQREKKEVSHHVST
jgi:heterodisulfide reductase subunit B